MAKGKPWTRAERNKQTERFMRDEDIYHPTELKDRKKTISIIMKIQDQKLRQEEEARERRGICQKCFMYLTTSGTCPNRRCK